MIIANLQYGGDVFVPFPEETLRTFFDFLFNILCSNYSVLFSAQIKVVVIALLIFSQKRL